MLTFIGLDEINCDVFSFRPPKAEPTDTLPRLPLFVTTGGRSSSKLICLRFGTTDDISGVLKYEVSINDGPWVQAVSPTPLENLSFGTYQFAVKAIDAFGNASFGVTQVRVYPFGTNPERVLANQVPEAEGKIKEFVIWSLVVGAIGVIILIFKKIKGKN